MSMNHHPIPPLLFQGNQNIPGTISACSKDTQSSKAMALIGSMKERRMRADVVSYNSIIRGNLGQVDAWRKTCQILDDLTPGWDMSALRFLKILGMMVPRDV